ncbi:AAA family ATPase [Mycoplasma sp. 1232]|uniref:AAA family ATPase n=1 Tax=Mycoplasma sp. 1232 TaxID=3108527 RepID=UPI002B25E7E0|nr:AAA family ATPase [Mycoplasma sp. 1232]MEA4333782.1 AAA family ATPase [Mycoplasma sp. 1232]
MKGKFIKQIKGGKELGWALMLFLPEGKSQTFLVFVTNVFPNLYKKYEVEFGDNPKASYKNSKIIKNLELIIEDVQTDWVDYLSKNVPNIGKLTAKKIIDEFGQDLFTKLADIENYRDELLSVITDKQLESLVKYYEENSARLKSLLNLTEEDKKNINLFNNPRVSDLVEKLATIHGSREFNFIEYYKNNSPYYLFIDKVIDDIFKVDTFAFLLNWTKENYQRYVAYLYKVVWDLETQNTTIFDLDTLQVKFKKAIEDANIKWNSLINEEESDFAFIKDEIDVDIIFERFIRDEHLIQVLPGFFTLKATFDKEAYIYNRLMKLANSELICKLKPEAMIDLKFLSKQQKAAYDNFINKNISIISGGPGTGKTFVIKHIYETLKKNKVKANEFAILAPTGRAATNVSIKIKHQIRTIHSYLQIANTDEKISLTNLEEIVDLRILIIDEFSMIDVNLLDKLLKASSKLEKIVLIGDAFQLPAIGPGNLLDDLIFSQNIPTTYLTKFYRSDSETIWKHFSNINRGEVDDSMFKPSEVDLVKVDNKNFHNDLLMLYAKEVEKFGINNVIILIPTYRYQYGINEVNKKIQNAINKNDVFATNWKNYSQIEYRINDKVMQLENRNNENISNGDIGYITDVVYEDATSKSGNKKVKKIKVTFYRGDEWKKEIEYSLREFQEQIQLAYSTTIHKFQGSEIDSVIMVIHNEHAFMQSKKMLYTGASRAIKHLQIFIDQSVDYKSLIERIHATSANQVHTNLRFFIQTERRV